MSGLFSINPSLLHGWKQTLTIFFSKIRRVSFVVEDTFSFGDFNPQVNWNGMTATVVSVNRARYLKIWKFFWFSIDISATLAAPFTTSVILTIPHTAYQSSPAGAHITAGLLQNAGAYEVGTCQVAGGSDQMTIFRTALGAYTAGAFLFRANGFIEVQ